jgi:acyl-CoA thioester hydrolase
MGRQWLIRETEIEYLRQAQYNDIVQVRSWVDDFRRVRSRRKYEFRLNEADGLVARAWTDWVFLNTTTGRPAAVPSEMVTAFFPEGAPPAGAPRPGFPDAPLPPPGIFKMRRRVEWRDIDPAQHVNNAAYLAYLEECGMQVVAAFGWSMERMWAEGFAIIARRHQIEYVQPAVRDDELEVATWVSAVKHATALRHFTITRVQDGALLVQVHTLWVWVDLKTGQPIRIPDHFLADFSPNIIGGWPRSR